MITVEDLKVLEEAGYSCGPDGNYTKPSDIKVKYNGVNLHNSKPLAFDANVLSGLSADFQGLIISTQFKCAKELKEFWIPLVQEHYKRQKALEEVKPESKHDLARGSSSTGITTDFEDFLICNDRYTGKSFLYDMAEHETDFDFDSFKKSHMISSAKVGGRDPRFEYRCAEIIYDYEAPKAEIIKFKKNRDGLRINSYNDPLWRKLPGEEAYIHPTLEKYLRWVYFDNDPTIERLLDFLARASFHFDPQMFIMATRTKGVGKTLQFEIFKNLMPEGRSEKLNRDVVHGQFDGRLANITFALMDEVNLTSKTAQEKIKQLISNTGYVSRTMYTESNKALQNFLTFMGATNVRRDLCLDQGERRFFIPNMREEEFGNFGTEEERTFITNLASPDEKMMKEVIAPFGRLLMTRFKENDLKNTPWEKFQRIKPLNYWLSVKDGWSEGKALLFEYLSECHETPIAQKQGHEFKNIANNYKEYVKNNAIKPVKITKTKLREWLGDLQYRGVNFAEPIDILEGPEQRWKFLIHDTTEYPASEYDSPEALLNLIGEEEDIV